MTQAFNGKFWGRILRPRNFSRQRKVLGADSPSQKLFKTTESSGGGFSVPETFQDNGKFWGRILRPRNFSRQRKVLGADSPSQKLFKTTESSGGGFSVPETFQDTELII
ncbi:hypothetical protein [Chlorogloea sp. CCALA 695]|uniref:hypothetical protein n=1 Tax=Chlorogloea sp. CCALA 695 TaxID=2107693 RepID=UPI000D04ADF4|nr:hypothetical protein [Chlorogloea sp. CCALA 695]PSB32769.1 hypothetical protein C7B70_09590 [Chlorogloea sp. CCALA 695]